MLSIIRVSINTWTFFHLFYSLVNIFVENVADFLFLISFFFLHYYFLFIPQVQLGEIIIYTYTISVIRSFSRNVVNVGWRCDDEDVDDDDGKMWLFMMVLTKQELTFFAQFLGVFNRNSWFLYSFSLHFECPSFYLPVTLFMTFPQMMLFQSLVGIVDWTQVI